MKSALRKMGNSTGLIVPAPVLAAAELRRGATVDLTLKDGRLVATPAASPAREGWAAAAEAIGYAPLTAGDADWLGFADEADAATQW